MRILIAWQDARADADGRHRNVLDRVIRTLRCPTAISHTVTDLAYTIQGPYCTVNSASGSSGAHTAVIYATMSDRPGHRRRLARLLAVDREDDTADHSNRVHSKRARTVDYDDADLATHWGAIRLAADIRALWRATVCAADPVAHAAAAAAAGELDADGLLPDAAINGYVYLLRHGLGFAQSDGRYRVLHSAVYEVLKNTVVVDLPPLMLPPSAGTGARVVLDALLVPLFDANHWRLLLAFPRERSLVVYDSLVDAAPAAAGLTPPTLDPHAAALLRAAGYRNPPVHGLCPQQHLADNNCALHALLNIERLCVRLEAGECPAATNPPDLRIDPSTGIASAASLTAKRAPLRRLFELVQCAADARAVVPFVLRGGPLLGNPVDETALITGEVVACASIPV